MTPDEQMMQRALEEARRAVGQTSPNPAVGAVIATPAGEILSVGHHRRAGQPHAEIEALRALSQAEAARGATLYVTLEPCSTHGRTPPCVEAILQAGLRRVVIGAIDPNPQHAGRGVEILRAAGVEVTSGVLAAECTQLNRAFNKWITTRRPWVIAKAGLSLDGRLTRPPGEGQWLTSPEARHDAHALRARVDAIVIGANTLRLDNPRLTVRDVPGTEEKPQPWRVIVAGSERPLPAQAHVFMDEHRDRTLIFRGRTLGEVLRELGEQWQVTSVLIEGGQRVLGDAFDYRLVDEVCFYLAPLLCGGPDLAVGGLGVSDVTEAPPLAEVQYLQIGDDLRMSGLVRRAQEPPRHYGNG